MLISSTRGIDGLGDVTVDGSIDVNNSPDLEGSGTSGDGAVVALSIVLALVLLAIIAGLVYYKRR